MENDKGEWSPANTAKQRTNAKPDKKLWNSSFDIAIITFISIKLETLLTHTFLPSWFANTQLY